MKKHIQILEANDWICDCEGPWGLIILTPSLHQERFTDINVTLWRLYASYRPLNSVINTFEFPIPRCTDSIEDFGNFSGRTYFISLDAGSSYLQFRVRKRG